MNSYPPRITCIICIACIICIVCISFPTRAQVTDDFSDGDFTSNPSWTGDTDQFEINSAGQLHLFSSGSDTSLLALRSSMFSEMEWCFWIKLSFNTSVNNHARIYLSADTSALLHAANSLYLQAGGTDDSIYLIQQTGATQETVYRLGAYKTNHSANSFRIKITCTMPDFWTIMIDTTGGGNYLTDGTFSGEMPTSDWFGLMCRYTSSNASKFYFDDFYIGPVRHDTVPPEVVSISAHSEGMLEIRFSEPVLPSGAVNRENYHRLSDGAMPDSVSQDPLSTAIVRLYYDQITNGTMDTLRINNIADVFGNEMPERFLPFSCYRPKAYDIVIHEIMADPNPVVGIPDGEYLELFNRSPFPIDIQGWTLKYGSYSKVFPACSIPAGGYLLVAKDSVFLAYSPTALLFTSSSSLSNEGTSLVLKDPFNHIIHAVEYDADWYDGSFKEEGGWSLEMKDPSNPCGCKDNWEPSRDISGGTPGRINSVAKSNPDDTDPAVLRAVIVDSASLEVFFSESMDSVSLQGADLWFLEDLNGKNHPQKVDMVSPGFESVILAFSANFQKGIEYRLRMTGAATDCAGNYADTSRVIRVALPDSITTGDVVINELLPNPASGGARFLELYNRSEKIIDLRDLVVSNHDTIAGMLPDAEPLTQGGYLLFPGEYIVFSSNPEDIISRYRAPFPETIVKMNGFPVFDDNADTVIIARKDNLEIIDKMRYDEEMHYPLLASSEGVSLERANPDLPSLYDNNWHSAAETYGFATPGYLNSHATSYSGSTSILTIEPAVFSPDNDGRDDLLTLRIKDNTPGYSADISVYDAKGRLIRILANNVACGNENVFIWDGMRGNHVKAPVGIYIILAELVWPDGTVKKIKKTAVLGGRR